MSDELRFKPAIWKIFSPKLEAIENNYRYVLQEPEIYANQMIAALIDVEEYIIQYLPMETHGKIEFQDEIARIEKEYGDIRTFLYKDDKRPIRMMRKIFLDHISSHMAALRIFVNMSGIGEGGESKDNETGATLVIRNATPSIFLDKWILQRLSDETEENVIEMILGATGSGKSMSAIEQAFRIMEKTGGLFSLDHVVFDIKDVLRLVYHTEPPIPRGSVIVFDDAGANANARDWRSQMNTILAKMAQTFRYRGIFFIITVPDQSFIDIQVRKSIHLKLISVVNDKGENQKGTFKVQVNLQDEEGNIEFGPPKLSPEDFGDLPFSVKTDNMQLESIHFSLPPEEFVLDYKNKKHEYLSRQIVVLEENMDMDAKLEEVRRKALYEKYSKMIEDQDDWDEISDLRKQAAKEKAEAAIARAHRSKDRTREDETIDQIIIERYKSGESLSMISEVVSTRIKPISKEAIHKRVTKLKDSGIL